MRSFKRYFVHATLLTVLSILIIVPNPKPIQATRNYCVQLFNMFADGVVNVLSVNPQTREATPIQLPTIPPNAMLSPDGKYAAFWQLISGKGPEAGLYI